MAGWFACVRVFPQIKSTVLSAGLEETTLKARKAQCRRWKNLSSLVKSSQVKSQLLVKRARSFRKCLVFIQMFHLPRCVTFHKHSSDF